MKATLFEAALVAAAGLAIAFAANALSPRGLKLTRNYFPGTHADAVSPVPAPQGEPPASRAGNDSSPQAVADRLRARGLQVIPLQEAARLFRDAAREPGSSVFIDARDDEHFLQSHIPRAYQFDHYHAEEYFAAVLPACQQAQKIVVYCHGGDCEDSEFAAVILRDAGVAREKLFVFVGGIAEWQSAGLPVEGASSRNGSPPP